MATADLPLLIPGAPRTETVVYNAGRRPFIPPLPSLDLPPREQHDAMLDLAANCLRFTADLRTLCGSEPHVRVLCETLERLDLHDAESVARTELLERDLAASARELALQQGLAAEYRRSYLAARDALQALALDLETAREEAAIASKLRESALADAQQQRVIAIRLSEQLAALTRPAAPVVVHVADLARLRGYTAPADWDSSDLPTVTGGPRYVDDDLDTVVVTTPIGGDL